MITFRSATYEVKIYCGGRIGYNGQVFGQDMVQKQLLQYEQQTVESTRRTSFPVRITQTLFVSGDRQESGFELASIRFPNRSNAKDELFNYMQGLAKYLLTTLEQHHVYLVASDVTEVYEADDKPNASFGVTVVY